MASVKEWLVLVDEKDNEIGTETRENCHRGKGLKHRAFVVFLFNGKKLLIQRRSPQKQLWPGYWDVSVTSHVYRGETYEEAGLRRIRQELNCKVDKLEKVLSFTYSASFGDYSENEYCFLLIGEYSGEAKPNPEEIMEVNNAEIPQLASELKHQGHKYTPWFKLAFEMFLKHHVSKKYL